MPRKKKSESVANFHTDPFPTQPPQPVAEASPVAAPVVEAVAQIDLQTYPNELVSVSSVEPNPWNPNEMDSASYSRLREEVQSVGFIEPIVVVPLQREDGTEFFRILGGEHRHRLAKEMNARAIPAIVLRDSKFNDEELQQALTVRLQILRGKLNRTKMVNLFRQFAEKHSAEETRKLFAVTDKSAWDKMIWKIKSQMQKAGLPAEALKELDNKTKDVRAAKDIGAIVAKLYEQYKDTVPFNFAIFAQGGRSHMYIATTKETHALLGELLAKCKEGHIEVNTVLAPMLSALVAQLGQKPENTLQPHAN